MTGPWPPEPEPALGAPEPVVPGFPPPSGPGRAGADPVHATPVVPPPDPPVDPVVRPGAEPAPTGAGGLGAMRDTLAIVAGAVTATGRAAERARGLADRLGDDRDRMVIALGGGPPQELREAAALNLDAVQALDEAATALSEAAAALRSFARRSS